MGERVQTSSNKEWDRVWIGANIASMVAGAEAYGKLESDALAVKGERIAWIGSAAEARRRAAAQDIPVEDCRGLWMTPGLIDCHTHLVYGGNRVEEFEKRLCGVSYEDIARAGGGIQSTVNATRARGHRCAACLGRGAREAADVRGSHHHRSEVRLRTRSCDGAAHAGSGALARARSGGVGQDDLSGPARAAAGISRGPPGLRRPSRAGPGSNRSSPPVWSMRSMRSARTSRSRLAGDRAIPASRAPPGCSAHTCTRVN